MYYHDQRPNVYKYMVIYSSCMFYCFTKPNQSRFNVALMTLINRKTCFILEVREDVMDKKYKIQSTFTPFNMTPETRASSEAAELCQL